MSRFPLLDQGVPLLFVCLVCVSSSFVIFYYPLFDLDGMCGVFPHVVIFLLSLAILLSLPHQQVDVGGSGTITCPTDWRP